ncbi:MAG: 3-deoxy-manno-octulosonate cytidylyltransferase [Spiribacter sp.]|nr:3-deoxy-manno-octulosonate cytidylyltransferase [Spiribacter sp.]MDR9480756.1 3-deoxy-manno-octulosonate cytidylyltransferase [Spiribacter sp.]
MSAFTVMIPARFAASRLPGKPLRELAGRPIITHVCERAHESGAERVIVATDDPRIADAVGHQAVEVFMTHTDHRSGTDRLAEVVTTEQLADDQIIVNLQGDEPLMPPRLLEQVARSLGQAPRAAMATLATPIGDSAEHTNPNVVKVVSDHHGRALYFSRAPIPHERAALADQPHGPQAMRHLGIYAYRVSFLRRYASLPASPLEALEQLEQLRALQAGEWIQVTQADQLPGPGIDTEADLQAAEAQLNRVRS